MSWLCRSLDIYRGAETISLPKRIANHEECYILLVGTFEDLIAIAFDLFSVCLNNRTPVERFLLIVQLVFAAVTDTADSTLTSFSFFTMRILVYASRYTLSALFTISRPLTVMSVSSARPNPTRYNMVVCSEGKISCQLILQSFVQCGGGRVRKSRSSGDKLAFSACSLSLFCRALYCLSAWMLSF